MRKNKHICCYTYENKYTYYPDPHPPPPQKKKQTKKQRISEGVVHYYIFFPEKLAATLSHDCLDQDEDNVPHSIKT